MERKEYAIIDRQDGQPIIDEDGDKVAIVNPSQMWIDWAYQKAFDMNGCKEKGRFSVRQRII